MVLQACRCFTLMLNSNGMSNLTQTAQCCCSRDSEWDAVPQRSQPARRQSACRSAAQSCRARQGSSSCSFMQKKASNSWVRLQNSPKRASSMKLILVHQIVHRNPPAHYGALTLSCSSGCQSICCCDHMLERQAAQQAFAVRCSCG